MISILKISKGNNSAKNVGGVTVYISAKFREIISSSIKVMKWTRMFGGYNIIPHHFLWQGIKRWSKGNIISELLSFTPLDLCKTQVFWL